MRLGLVSACGVLFFLAAGTLWADAPELKSGVKIQDGTSFLEVTHYAAPTVADWNNDGKKDMLCGTGGGVIYLLINEGTDPDPVFNAYTLLKNGYGVLDVGNESHPVVLDWDGDGKKDLIMGESKGRLAVYQNKGTDGDPKFNGSTYLTAGGSELDVGYYCRPDLVDWNNDGVMDFLCGNFVSTPVPTSNVTFFESVGPLALDKNWITGNSGGAINLHLGAGVSNSGRNYLILGSVTGTEPGTPLPGGNATLPINWDMFTGIVVSLLNSPVCQNFMGTLDGNGEAAATFDTIGPVPGAVGLYLYFAYGLNTPWDYASNGAAVEIVP